MQVFACARNFEKLIQLSEQNTNIIPLEMDVNDKNSVKTIFEKIKTQTKSLDFCVNAAGIFLGTSIFSKDDNEDFEQNIQTNLMGTWYVCKQAAKFMKEKNTEGSIINIGSIVGDAAPMSGASGYCVSKSGVIHLTKALVGELSEFKIRINCISPGAFNTKIAAQWIEENGYQVPLEFVADPENIKGLVLYLASNKLSNYVTGADYVIDGGLSWFKNQK